MVNNDIRVKFDTYCERYSFCNGCKYKDKEQCTTLFGYENAIDDFFYRINNAGVVDERVYKIIETMKGEIENV